MTSPSPVDGPCGWDDPIFCCTLPTGSESASGNWLYMAAEVLDEASAHQFGLCERTVRPCRRECQSGSGSWFEWGFGRFGAGLWPRPLLYDGQWFNIACGSCSGTCSCTVIEEAKLPGSVYAITQVMLGGEIMATGSYRVDEDNLLVRTDGGRWPICQDMTQPDDGPDAWAVTAQFGRPLTFLARQAFGELICEFGKACSGQDCRLPANVTNLVRQGATIAFDADKPYWERLYWVKTFLDTVNPDRRGGRSQAFDLDGPGFRRTNTTAW